MLKITELERKEASVVLKVEGRVAAEWITEFETTCNKELADGLMLTLDMQDVRFVERSAIPILQRMVDRNVEFVKCSPLLSRQIERRNGYVDGRDK
jgi:hypothetical protein